MRTTVGLLIGAALLWSAAPAGGAAQAASAKELALGARGDGLGVDDGAFRPQTGQAAGEVTRGEASSRTPQRDIGAMRRELQAKLRFLGRAHRAFFVAHMSTTDVKARIAAAQALLADLDRAADDPAQDLPEEPGRAELQAELAFLERAHRAFFAAHHSTTEVKLRIREVERRLEEIGGRAAVR